MHLVTPPETAAEARPWVTLEVVAKHSASTQTPSARCCETEGSVTESSRMAREATGASSFPPSMPP
jgi:hypothetical protein